MVPGMAVQQLIAAGRVLGNGNVTTGTPFRLQKAALVYWWYLLQLTIFQFTYYPYQVYDFEICFMYQALDSAVAAFRELGLT